MNARDIIYALQKDIEDAMRERMEVPEYIEMTQEQYDIIYDSLKFVVKVTNGVVPKNTFSGIPIKVIDP